MADEAEGTKVGNIYLELQIKNAIEKQISPLTAQIQGKFDKMGNRFTNSFKKMFTKMPKVDTSSVESAQKKVATASNTMTASLEKSSKKAQDKLQELKASINQTSAAMDSIIAQHQKNYADIYNIKGAKRGDVDALVEKEFTKDKGYQKLGAQLDKLLAKEDLLKSKIITPTVDNGSVIKATSLLDRLKAKITTMRAAIKKPFSSAKQNLDNFEKNTSKTVGRTSNMFSGLGARIRRTFWTVFLISGVMLAFKSIQSAITSTMSTNKQFQNSLASVKANLAAAFQPIQTVMIPLLNSLMSALANATAYIASFLRGFFGVIGAVSKSAKAAIAGVGSSAKSSGKEASQGLAGFDKINNLSSGSGGSSGSGSSAIAGDFKEIESARKAGERLRQMFSNLWGFVQKHKPLFIAAFAAIGTALFATFAVDKISTIQKSVSGFFSILGGAGAIFTPLTIAIAAIAALLVYLYQTNEQVRANLDAAWTSIQVMFGSVVAQIQSALIPTFELIGTVWRALWSDVIEPVGLLIVKIIKDLVDTFVKLWQQYGETTFAKIKEAITTLKDTFVNVWNSFLKPVFDAIFDTLKKLWTDHLQPLVEKIGGFVSTLIGFAADIYNGFIAPIISWIADNLGPVFGAVIGGMIGSIGNFLGTVADVVGNVIGIFKGLIKFLTSVFKGDWAGAWEGIKSVFSNIISGLANIFKAPINLIIGGINAFVDGVNKIKVPDWVPVVGGKGFNIGHITPLRVGLDYVPSDNFPALLHEGESVLTASQNSVIRKFGGIQAAIGLLRQSPTLSTVNANTSQKTSIDSSGTLTELITSIKQLLSVNSTADKYSGDFVMKIDKDAIAKIPIAYILDYIRTHGELPFPISV